LRGGKQDNLEDVSGKKSSKKGTDQAVRNLIAFVKRWTTKASRRGFSIRVARITLSRRVCKSRSYCACYKRNFCGAMLVGDN
jgi:hypothetical protein